MITSIFPPSSGNITVNGFNVVTETKAARRSMSLCPQHNVLYNELTVREHLKLYAKIKGVPSSQLTEAINRITEQLQLTPKLNNESSTLSGGMKRKLCLGIALIGDTKVVILDEPTSGLDPDARRIVWDLLQSVRRDRTILLTTHYMEEADALGDRIAIMAAGEVKCCGTPMFLKRLFGSGYQLRIAKGSEYKGDAIFSLVCKYFPTATITNNIETEIVYCLGEQNTSDILLEFFEKLEQQKKELGISSCGLSATTIEDVFLGVNSMPRQDSPESESANGSSSPNGSTSALIGETKPEEIVNFTGIQLQLQRLKGLLLKRVHFTKRSLPLFYFQLLIPCLMFLFLLLLDKHLKSNKMAMTRLNLDLYEMYGKTKNMLKMHENNDLDKFYKYYKEVAKNLKAEVLIVDKDKNISLYVSKQTETMNVNVYMKSYLTGLCVKKDESGRIYNIWYNNEATHSLPAIINLLYNSLLKETTLNESGYSIKAHSDPLPNKNRFLFEFIMVTVLRLMWSIIIPMSIPFIAASYVYFPVHEKQTKAKLLQLMTGLHPSLYWISNFLFDILTHTVCSLLIVLIFLTTDFSKIFIDHCESMMALYLLLLFFGISSIPVAYVISFVPKTPSSGFALLVILFLIFGVILSIIDFILKIVVIGGSISQDTYSCFESFIRIFPLISLTKGIVKLYYTGTVSKLCQRLSTDAINIMCSHIKEKDILFGCCKDKCKNSAIGCFEWENPFQWKGNGIVQELTTMLIDSIVFFCILSLIESRFANVVCRLMQNLGGSKTAVLKLDENQDSDVVEEKHRIEKMMSVQQLPEDCLVVNDLTKQFKNFFAVKKLTFGLHSQECFGLLGINGAGKTSTFQMLAGELIPSDGNAFFGGLDLKNRRRDFQQKIGYCPQFDALLDKLTGRETLYLFGRLRGIPECKIKTLVAEITEMVDLIAHVNKKTEDYSGGNRRKLSLGMALIGSPSLVFLDEPSAGVDPQARRKLWKTLTHIRSTRNCSIVLTSHSMDECEALCSRIAIMVNGEFKCLGSIQYLRNKFGQGFTISVKVKRDYLSPEYIEQVTNHILQMFASASVKDYNETVIDYHIADSTVSWPYLLKTLTDAKNQFDFEDYSISDTTLEQIFLSFARQQKSQFLILLWKCGILRKRHYISTLFEIILPLVTSAILAGVYSSQFKSNISHREMPTPGYHPPVSFKDPTFDFEQFLITSLQQHVFVSILYCPRNAFTQNLTKEMNQVVNSFLGFDVPLTFKGFDSEDELVAYFLNSTRDTTNPLHLRPMVGIVISESPDMLNDDVLSRKFHYKFRLTKNWVEDTTKLFPLKSSPGPFNHLSHYVYQFAPLQTLVNEAYLNLVAANFSVNRILTGNVQGYKLPYPQYMEKPKTAITVVDQIPLIIVFGFIITAPIIVKRLADEKVSRCREMYRLMGLNDWIFWGSTFTNYFIIYLFQAILLTFLYMTKFNGTNALINYGNPFLIFISFVLYGIAFIMQSMLLSIPFNRPIFGVIVTVISWMVSYMLPVYFLDPIIAPNVDVRATNIGRVMACLLPNMALHFTFRVVSQKEVYGTGSSFYNLFEEVAVFGSLSHGIIIIMMLLSILVFGVLIWYLDAVWPWQYGVPKPFYFLCLPSFWCKRERHLEYTEETRPEKEKYFERPLLSSEVAIRVKNLKKEFGSGLKKKVAVSNASLDINRGQITVLLGHNGAGKTTMMNVITGIFPPNSGKVVIEGHNIVSETKAARRSMSLCPQHNVLYDELTVDEHLQLYAAIKGTPWESLKEESLKVIEHKEYLDREVKAYFPHASVASDIDTEIVYRLEDSNKDKVNNDSSKMLPSFFESFERKKHELGIASCGLSVTTIEDVFLGVSSVDDDYSSSEVSTLSSVEIRSLPFGDQTSVEMSDSYSLKLSGYFLFLQQVKGLFIKRYHFSRRYLPMIIFQVIIPALIFMLILYLDTRLKSRKDESTKMKFNLYDLYGSTIAFDKTEGKFDLKNLSDYYSLVAKNEEAKTFQLSEPTDIDAFLINKTEEMSVNEYIRTYLVGTSFLKLATKGSGFRYYYKAWYNNEALHSFPISLNLLYNAMLREVTSNSSDYSIDVSVEAFPSYESFNYQNLILLTRLRAMWSVIVPLSLPFLAASYVLFPIHEISSKSKLLQLMTGLYSKLFWLVNSLFDIGTHLLACILIFFIIAAMDKNQIFFAHIQSTFALFTLLILFGLSSIPMAYIFSFLPKKASTGFAVVVIFLLVCGVILSIVDFVLLLGIGTFITQVSYDTLSWIFKMFPIMSMTKGIVKLYTVSTYEYFCNQIADEVLNTLCNGSRPGEPLFGCCKKQCEKYNSCYGYETPWKWNGNGIMQEITLLILNGIIFYVILTLIESNFARLWYHVFGNRFQNLEIVQRYNQRFITEDARVTLYRTEDQREDSDVVMERNRIEELLNNRCFEEEALVVSNLKKRFKNLVAVNGLTFGIHNQECFGLLGVNGAGKTSTFRMLVGDLFPSDGNAFCGYFDLRHNLKKKNYGCSIVLTSHSMDECEALCGRIAIMVNGELKCLGNFQHLRSKFGQGYTLKIKAKREKVNDEYIEELKNHITRVLQSSVLKDCNETVLEYHITNKSTKWSILFKLMDECKNNFDLEDYTISDTTLEQIFISLARHQQQL
ncbi:ATP-binding cassette sub-family A member 1-like protein [Leptotrombidium deliense]|uniref:ATP-binding cassette sub-family A member 1-like protein n=1 Tax=Leptotrombidium deliense TaxID=299467 RepID=A0A443SRZ5_9ACAR|nr:ATP-binding cassette sub-family A member 1-like protein [Leptotrombidium deliense]